MGKLLLALVLGLTGCASLKPDFAANVSRTPSSAKSVQVTIDGVNYSCTRGGNSQGDCLIVPVAATDAHGTYCDGLPADKNYRYDFCAFYYQFGVLADHHNANLAAEETEWCKQKSSAP